MYKIKKKCALFDVLSINYIHVSPCSIAGLNKSSLFVLHMCAFQRIFGESDHNFHHLCLLTQQQNYRRVSTPDVVINGGDFFQMT